MPTIDSALFKSGMRRLASGVSVITAEYLGQRGGLIATSVSSVSMAPPTLLVCVNETASSHDLIKGAGAFCVNVLGREAHEVAARFSTPAHRATRFETGSWTTLETGAPALAGSLASFDCRVSGEAKYGTHTIFFGEICVVKLWTENYDPLLYFDGGYRTLGGVSSAA
jgi:flavin reductase